MKSPESSGRSGAFPTTLWTQIIEVYRDDNSEAGEQALVAFCEQYRPVVYSFFLRHGSAHHDAEELTQAFFLSQILSPHALKQGFLRKADRAKCPMFRKFLCTVLWRFLRDHRESLRTQRRGGDYVMVPLLDADLADAAADGQVSENFGHRFDLAFALGLIERAAEGSKHSKYLVAHFRDEISQAAAAEALGLGEVAFRVAYKRFCDRLVQRLRDEVKKEVGPDETAIKEEIHYLLSLFRRPPM